MDQPAPHPPGSRRGEWLLLLAATIWGLAFVAQRSAMQHLGPCYFTGVRFLMGAALLCALPRVRRAWRAPSPQLAQATLVCGLCLTPAATLQQVGLVQTTAGEAAFITGLYVVLVPLVSACTGRAPAFATGASALVAGVGLYFVAVSDGLRLDPGNGWVLASAFLMAAHVIAIDRRAGTTDPLALAAGQFAMCGALALAAAPCLEPMPANTAWLAALPELLYGGFLSVGLAYTLQVVGQRNADPTHAAIIMSLESPIGALGGMAALGEGFTPRQAGGCAAMLAAMVASQVFGQPVKPAESVE